MPPKKRTQTSTAGGVKKRAKKDDSAQPQAASSSGSSGSSSEWCMDCGAASAAACHGTHRCVSVQAARLEAEARLRAAQATLRDLDSLGVKLTAFATLRDDEGETEEGSIGITLTVTSLSSAERQAVLQLLEGLDFPSGDEDCLSCNGSQHAALPGLRARLATRGAGTTLKAGAILIRGDKKVCIYYDREVKPTEDPGAKVLGYISTNLELIGGAKPKGLYHLSGWGNRWHCGSWVELQNVKFV